jgi:Uma2 family endonuclease
MQDVAIPDRKLTVEEFLDWYEHLPPGSGRYELWDGRIREKHGGAGSVNAERTGHARMKAAFFSALQSALEKSKLTGEVLIDGPQVTLEALRRNAEPDVLLYLGDPVDADTLIIPEPVIVCEVLSPSTAQFDMSEKLTGYFQLPSVAHYLIGDPDVPQIIHHRRGPGDTLITRTITASTEPLLLDPPRLSVDLARLLPAHEASV